MVAWCLRFMFNAKIRDHGKRRKKTLLLQEVNEAENRLLHLSQARHFKAEIQMLSKSITLPANSILADRTPYMDHNGLLRVGGHLGQANLDYSIKHPIILHRKDNLVKLLGHHIHEENQHIDPTGLLGLLSNGYYIIGAKHLVRAISQSCVRSTPEPRSSSWGRYAYTSHCSTSLHSSRSRFCGSIHSEERIHMQADLPQILFICLSTKAIHTEAFIASLKQFVARRGCPETLRTDNGTNFVGARKELNALYELLDSSTTQDKMSRFCTAQKNPLDSYSWTSTLFRRYLGISSSLHEDPPHEVIRGPAANNRRVLLHPSRCGSYSQQPSSRSHGLCCYRWSSSSHSGTFSYRKTFVCTTRADWTGKERFCYEEVESVSAIEC